MSLKLIHVLRGVRNALKMRLYVLFFLQLQTILLLPVHFNEVRYGVDSVCPGLVPVELVAVYNLTPLCFRSFMFILLRVALNTVKSL